jgi:glucan phosphorylase
MKWLLCTGCEFWRNNYRKALEEKSKDAYEKSDEALISRMLNQYECDKRIIEDYKNKEKEYKKELSDLLDQLIDIKNNLLKENK